MILSTREPQCIFVTPKRIGLSVDINYSISGVNEEQVEFIVSHTNTSRMLTHNVFSRRCTRERPRDIKLKEVARDRPLLRPSTSKKWRSAGGRLTASQRKSTSWSHKPTRILMIRQQPALSRKLESGLKAYNSSLMKSPWTLSPRSRPRKFTFSVSPTLSHYSDCFDTTLFCKCSDLRYRQSTNMDEPA